MKIIQVIPHFGLGGAEIMCENLIYELLKRKHEVIVVSLFDYHSAITERLEEAGVKILYLDKKKGLDISLIPQLIRIFKSETPDVVHTHRNAVQYAITASLMTRVTHKVHTVHNVAKKENVVPVRWLNKLFFKYFNVIPVALSELIRETIAKEYKMVEDKIPVIFNGINLSKCNPKYSYEVAGSFKILHIGRFYEQKNHSGLLEAFRLFHTKYPDSELWLIGEGEKRDEMVNFVNQNNLTTAVKFLGAQNNVYSFLHDADIFTLPSNYEGMPITLIEAMGTGMPIVATAVGGVPDMLTNNDNALLVENDVMMIAGAFEKYYMDTKLRRLHGERAKERAEQFSSTIMAQKYERVYLRD